MKLQCFIVSKGRLHNLNMMIPFSFQFFMSRTALESILTSQYFSVVQVRKAFTVAVGH